MKSVTNKFRLGKKLGYGRFAEVFRVTVIEGKRKGEEVAMKKMQLVPTEGENKGKDLTENFKQEVAALYTANQVSKSRFQNYDSLSNGHLASSCKDFCDSSILL